jgi:hypothetical protein
MREVRRSGTHRYVFPCDSGKEVDIDLGLIDIQVNFNGYSGPPTGSPMTDANFEIVDRLCGKALHTQMVIATAVHYCHPDDGRRALHYHNLIFALRKQVEPDEHIGAIDLLPLVHALGGPLNIVEEV